MKAIAASILLAVFAVSATAAVRSLHPQRAAADEPCIGLSCWPDTPPTKHRPAQPQNLEPVW
jgi:hypothetical protein